MLLSLYSSSHIFPATHNARTVTAWLKTRLFYMASMALTASDSVSIVCKAARTHLEGQKLYQVVRVDGQLMGTRVDGQTRCVAFDLDSALCTDATSATRSPRYTQNCAP